MKAISALILLLIAIAFLQSPAVAAQYRILKRLQAPDGGFDYATFDLATHRIYMVRPSFTTVVDTKTDMLSRLDNAGGDHIALPIPGSNLLLITQRRGVVHLVDKRTDRLVAEIAVGKNPNSATYDGSTKLAYVMNKDGGDMSVINLTAQKVTNTISVGGTLEFVVSNDQGKLFDNIKSADQIAVVNTRKQTIIDRYSLPGCHEPTGLAYVSDRNLLISACSNGVALIIQADTGKKIASVQIAHGPDAVIYDPVRKLAFIPCGDDGVLEIISISDPERVSVVQRLRTQEGTRTGALDPDTGYLYLLASRPDPSAVGKSDEEDGARLSGSFQVLVVGPS